MSVECDKGHLDHETVVDGSGVDLAYKEELKLEAEVKKLEETLEYQMMIENQAKQKHLAEKHKSSAMKTLEKNAALDLPDDNIINNDNDKHVSGKMMNCWQVIVLILQSMLALSLQSMNREEIVRCYS